MSADLMSSIAAAIDAKRSQLERQIWGVDPAKPGGDITSEVLLGWDAATAGLVIRASEHVPRDLAYLAKVPALDFQVRDPDPTEKVLFCGTRFYRSLIWETYEKYRWAGRDRRRLKRERRKFVGGRLR